MSPAKQWAMVVLMLFGTAVWTVNSAMSLGDWRPPFLALVGVGILFGGAAVLARVNRQPGQQRSSGHAAWLDGCPGWVEGVVLGLIVVALGTALFRSLRSLSETAAAARGWAFDPLLVFLFGGLTLVFLLQMRQVCSAEDEQ
ncbi:MAG: hypothetical protein F4230_02385 [Holophagales bacterium]|nr:hypothetical protein [Holophagales bacterium]MYF03863.1 hypothetical protein [Holophagales bacterium]MYJ26255.1 hypothetical protein [Holophagales bacterium]